MSYRTVSYMDTLFKAISADGGGLIKCDSPAGGEAASAASVRDKRKKHYSVEVLSWYTSSCLPRADCSFDLHRIMI